VRVEGKNVLITGGAGFIGSHLAEEYLKNDVSRLIVLDDLSTGSMENLEHIKDNRLEIVKGSILDKKNLDEVIKEGDINIVDHLAAELEVHTGIKDSEKDAQINIIGTLNVLNTAFENNLEKLLFASSGAVYGEAQYVPQDEKHPLEPHWPYGVSKLCAERYCIQYYKLFNLDTTAFRYGIVYGPREWFGRVLTMFIKRIFLENKPPVVFGNGQQVRDFIYVKDVVRAHMLAIRNRKASGQVFNISSGKGTSINELAETLIKVSSKKLKIVYDDPIEGEASHLQPERIRLERELEKFVLGNKKAGAVLGWRPKVGFLDGVLEEIRWISGCPRKWKTKPRV
jgi:UDP-glucose 4-epimerase